MSVECSFDEEEGTIVVKCMLFLITEGFLVFKFLIQGNSKTLLVQGL